ncbi:MAG: organomercurial lyase [bacterium]
MTRTFDVKRAVDLMNEEFTAKWRDRQSVGALSRLALGVVHERILASGAPVKIDTVISELFLHGAPDVRAAIAELDEKDLVAIRDGHIVLAYPFASAPTAFCVVLPDGRQRYAACAIDALGVAPMLGHPVTIHSRCHHCEEPLTLAVRPDGPLGADGVMVWVGDRDELRQKAFDSL